MRPRAVTLVAAGQVSFVALLGVCVALHPGLVLKRDEGGVSNYGVHLATAVPYSLAYLLDACLVALGARRLTLPGAPRRLRVGLYAFSALLVATLVTSYAYTRSPVLKDLHLAVGTALVVAEGVGATWLARAVRRPIAAPALLVVLATGLVLCLLASAGLWHVLFVGQVLVTAGFAPLLVEGTRSLGD